MTLTLAQARTIVAAAFEKAAELKLKPLTVAVLDAAGDLVALERQDGASPLRPAIAIGKANGAVQLGMGTRAIMARAESQPFFIQSMNALCNGSLVPVLGGVLIRENGQVVGAVGITGDTSENDETAAIAGIEAVKLEAVA